MMHIVNPANGNVIKTLETDSAITINHKVERAKKAQSQWALEPYSVRRKCLSRLAEALKDNLGELASTLNAEMGKSIVEARAEILATIPRIAYFLENVPQATKGECYGVFDGVTREQITFEPLGVVANISAWNYPFFVGINVIAPALLTGNAVMYKPSELATLTGMHLTKFIHESGVPEDVFAMVVGGKDEGRLLVDAPVDGIFFTGSHATGKHIAQATAGRMLHLQLELGGNDAVYVCEDAPIDTAAASIAEGFLYNQGQGCCSVERIYVHETIYAPFITALKNHAATYTPGPLAQNHHGDFLRSLVADALAKGATLELGLDSSAPLFSPTIVGGCRNTMRIMREEIFGPLAGVCPVKNDQEAIALINDSTYGLTAAVFSTQLSRAESILSRINVGTAYINCCDRVSPRLPWSGRNHSGMGTTLSWLGIQSFVRPKAWHIRG